MKKLLAFFLASFCLLHSDFSQSILTADGLAAYIPPAAGGGGGGGGGGSAFPSDSISADIRFNNGGTDSSGNGNTVTAHGTTSYVADEAGNATHAIQLDGSTGYADMVSAMNFGAGSFSVVTWCTNLSADFASPLSPVLWGNAAFGSGYYFQLQVAAGGNTLAAHAVFQYHDGAGDHAIKTADRAIAPSLQMCLVFVNNGGVGHIYLNGSDITSASQPAIGTVGNGTSGFTMGKYTGGGSFFSGNIQQVIIYSRALTPTEVTTGSAGTSQ